MIPNQKQKVNKGVDSRQRGGALRLRSGQAAALFLLLLLIPCTLLLAPSSAHAALTTGLVGYWTFDGTDMR